MTEDLALEALLEFLNAAEAGIASAKHMIAEKKGVLSELPDFDKLFWEKRQGNKGEYEQTSKSSNNNSNIFQRLQQELKDHKGFWQHNGYKYWFHQQDQDVIDRRRSKKNG